MGRSEPPKVLEMMILILGAPMDICRVWRRVASRMTEPELWLQYQYARHDDECVCVWGKYELRWRHVVLLHELRHADPGVDPVGCSILTFLDCFDGAGISRRGEKGQCRKCDGKK